MRWYQSPLVSSLHLRIIACPFDVSTMLPRSLIHCYTALLRCMHAELPAGTDPLAMARAFQTTCDHSYWRVMGLPILTYMAWQLGYLLWTEVWKGSAIRRDREQLSSLRWTVRAGKGLLHDLGLKMARALGLLAREEGFDEEDWRTKGVFIVMQLLYTVVTLLPTKLLYDHYWLHAGFLGLMGMSAVW